MATTTKDRPTAVLTKQLPARPGHDRQAGRGGEGEGAGAGELDINGVRMKKCARCGEVYPMTTEYWYLNKSARDGMHSYCRACRREYQSDYWSLNYSNDGRARRKNMLKPVDYVVLHSEEGGVLYIVHSGGGLAVGRVHAVFENALPQELQDMGLVKLCEITTTETNFQRTLERDAEKTRQFYPEYAR